jgi:hypothetical protein
MKHDHFGFEILYVYRSVVRKYRPDFVIRLVSGDSLVLQTRGNRQRRLHDRVVEIMRQALQSFLTPDLIAPALPMLVRSGRRGD